MQPRQMRETLSPVLPRLTYSIATPSNYSDRPGHNHPWSSELPLHMSLLPPATMQSLRLVFGRYARSASGGGRNFASSWADSENSVLHQMLNERIFQTRD